LEKIPVMMELCKKLYFRYLWWFWQIVLVLFSLFFMVLGIKVFLFAYQLEDPFTFILSFFSSNLIILISAVLLFGLIYRMIGVYRLVEKKGGARKSTRNNEK
jgi:hypothetical protein